MSASRRKGSDEKNTEQSWLSWLQVKSGLSTHSTTPLCSDGQCMMRAPIRSVSIPAPAGFTLPLLSIEVEDQSLVDVLPPDYYESMTLAAKFGFLYTFLKYTPDEFLNQHFMQTNLSDNQIYYAKQSLNALSMLALSAYFGFTDTKSLLLALGTPAASAVLKYAGYSETACQLYPASMLVVTQLVTDIENSTKTLLSLLSGISGGLLGNQAAQLGYKIAHMGIFSIKSQLTSIVANEAPLLRQ